MTGPNVAAHRSFPNANHSGEIFRVSGFSKSSPANRAVNPTRADRGVLGIATLLFLGAAAPLSAQTPIAPTPISVNSSRQPCGAVILVQHERVMLCAEGKLFLSDMQGRSQRIAVDTTILPYLSGLWPWKADSAFLYSAASRRTAAILDASGKIARTVEYVRSGGSPLGDRIIGLTAAGELLYRDREVGWEVLGREHELQDTVRLLALGSQTSRMIASWVAAGEHNSRIGMHGVVLEPVFVRRFVLASGPNLIASGYSDTNEVDVLDPQGRVTRKIRVDRTEPLRPEVLKRMVDAFVESGDPATRPHRERLLARLASPRGQQVESVFVDADDRVWIKRRNNAGCEWEIHPPTNAAVRRVPMICDFEPVSARGNYLVTWGAGMLRVWRFGGSPGQSSSK